MPQPLDRPSIKPAPGVLTTAAEVPVDDRPRPFDPSPTSRAGAYVLALRTLQDVHPGTRDLRTAAQLLWLQRHPKATCSLPTDLKQLGKLMEKGLVAQQRPLGPYGTDIESHWWAVETPYWKPGDEPRLVKPPRQKRPRR
jgi:hypothetical protein